MTSETYRFQIGTFECLIVNDGMYAYPHPARLFFANAPHEPLRQALHEHNVDVAQWDVYVSPYPSLVVNTGQHLALVDTGGGDLAPTTGQLIPNLQRAGIAPEDIDTVILTHAHPDHLGGAVGEDGQLAFPRARYVMGRDEWQFWNSDPDLAHLQIPDHIKELILEFAQQALLRLAGHIELIDPGTELVPGIQAVAAPGHTPGHMALDITSGGERLLAVCDAVMHPMHVGHPDWVAAFDYSPEQVIATRQRLLKRAAEEEALVFAFHFPYPGLGRVIQHGQGWQWQPVAMTERVDL
jgi:glyoxylase-like metal-dependent hydrolase (beta-lactamase superfamily II)